ncbi:MAG: insulinase family protein [Odoribacter sp.]|nr:insulinase family protein [Odoribacter sp.]
MYQTHILKNGLKVIHQRIAGRAAWCGLIIGVGSRDERPEEEGIAHFIEHVIFKGTEKRKAFHILSRIEDVGGELNAYTTKEDTCIYASFLPKDYGRTLELFSDIVFHSVFPEKEILKEKEVVIDEINSYKDSPGELIFDDFEELIYRNYPIGRNILGSEQAVKRLRREDILSFVKRNYKPSRMVISSIGDIPFEKLAGLVERYFGEIPGDEAALVRCRPELYVPRTKEVEMDTYQHHCIIGNVAYDYTQDNRLALSLLVNVLGGSGMNSRLNLNIREKYGLAYNVEAAYTPYSDTGVFTVYFGCDAEDLDKCMRLCRKEMNELCEMPLGQMQLKKAKAQMIGQMTLASENYENAMLSIGKSFLIYGKVDELEDICAEVQDIRAEVLQQIAREVFAEEKQSVLIYK